MGFYGNISNTSKTNFSFDLIYNSRVQMEEAMDTDGVFLGRYVLIQYDTPPVQAYYNHADNWMYNSTTFNEQTKIKNPTNGQLYQDLSNINSAYGFYYYDSTTKTFVGVKSVSEVSTPYAFYFRKDVSAYGRGYDATVWMKQFDPNSGKYKYVMTAELNAVVPTFHLILDPPSEAPIAPYFDRDTTNIDYYLHQQAQYGARLAEVPEGNPSDEKVRRKKIDWQVDQATGMQVWKEINSVVDGDIYYNKAGFDYANRSESTGVPNEINYEYVMSGRVYGGDPDTTVYDENKIAEDTYEWRVRLPAIGNSICYMWDKVYGTKTDEDGNPINGERTINLSQQANDTQEHLVTYDRSTLMGTINTIRDMLGYYFMPKTLAPSEIITDSTETIKYAPTANGITWPEASYRALDCLYYEVDDNNAVSKYYYYAYTPIYQQFTGTSLSDGIVYYIKDGSTYRLANKGLWNAQDANGTSIPAQTLYVRTDAWKLTELAHGPEDGVYAIIAHIHTILGTDATDERSVNTIKGAINSMKDLLGSINPDLKPGRLLHTNVETGQIEVTDTYFPGSNDDTTRVLAGNGDWVNRFNSMTVTAGESAGVANLAVPSGAQVLDASNEHNNNFNITTGNKWIRIAGDPSTNTTTFGHLVQSISNTTATTINHNDGTEEFSTQVVTWDEAGHIRSAVTTPHQLPMSYKTISIGDNVDKVEPETNINSVIADTTLDTLQLAPGNKWVNIAAYEKAKEDGIDTIKFSHKLSGVKAGSYGLATDETIESLNADNQFEVPYLTIDEAGHVTKASTETITIPENFENVKLEVSADDLTGELTAEAGTFKPTTLTDTLTFATTNKWIRANADTANRKISFAHRLTSVTPKTGTINQNNADTFETYDFAFDQAGHVIEKTTRTITIPNAFKQFAVGAVSTAVTDLAEHAEGTCSPDKTQDTLTLYSGNKWIHIAANRAAANSSTDDSITFGHSVYYTTPQTSVSTAATPNFGATFMVPHFTVDEAGHVNNINSHTIKIPLPSLSDNNTVGNVITSVALAPAIGAITISKSYIGNLALTNYVSAVTAPTDKNVKATDSLNIAIKKLEQQVIDEATARSNAITQEVKDRDAAIKVETDARKQAITNEENARNTAINTAISTEVTNRNNAINDAIDTEVTNRNTAINTAVNNLVNDAPAALDTLKELSDALTKGDSDLSATLINLKTSVDGHIANRSNPHHVTAEQLGLSDDALNNMINSAIESALGNFTVTLAEPVATINTSNPSQVSVTVTKFADTTNIRWEKQESGGFTAVASAPANPYTMTATSAETAGTYRFFLIRTYMGRSQEFQSKQTYTLTYGV